MTNKTNEAQIEYEAAVEKLKKFCDDHTDLTAYIIDTEYPIRVQFIPDPQLSLFTEANIDENGEVNDLTVTVGLSTTVKSTLKFKMDSKLLKKLIKLAESVGSLYYHAFREEQGERITPMRPIVDTGTDDVLLWCPNCGNPINGARTNSSSAFCQDCGQALDLTQDTAKEAET